MKMLDAMLVLAVTMHSGQFDKAGKPYILHVLTVMNKLRSDDEELNCIALGHDLVEDTGTTYSELYTMGFSERVVAGIRCLTKVPGQTNEEYLQNIKSNVDAIRVKLCDLEHNSDIRRLKGLTEKDFKRLQKYQVMYAELKSALHSAD